MRKEFKCKKCGEEEAYEISGSWFYIVSSLSFIFIASVVVEVGFVYGAMLGTFTPSAWKTITAFGAFMGFLWTIRAAQKWLPNDYEKPAQPEP